MKQVVFLYFSPVREVDISTAEGQVNTDYSLSSRAEGFVYDLCLFDDHVKTGKKIKVMS